MKVEQLNPRPNRRADFSLAAFKMVPKISGCYVLTTYDGVILYIGLATNLNVRFLQHLDNPEKTNPTADGKAVGFYYLEYDAGNLPKLERTWLNQVLNIRGQHPILNKMSSPIS